MIDFIESLLQKTGEQLYNAAQEFKDKKDYNNYCIYLTMSANFDYPEAKATIFKNDNYLFDKQDYSYTCQFYKLTSFGHTNSHKQVNPTDPITNFVNSPRNSYSLRYLGYMYGNGYGVTKNSHESIKCLELAIEKGNYETLNPLGHLYCRNSEVLNYEKATKLFEQAIEKKVPSAFASLGIIYERGLGVEKDYQRAIELYKLGVEYDDYDAINNLGNIYYYGKVERNVSKAKKLFIKATEKGDRTAPNNLGNMYYSGTSISKDYKKAKKFYTIAIKRGNNCGLFRLAEIYYSESNYTKSVKFYTKAVDNKNTNAMCKLGHLYRWGTVIQKDLQKSKELHKRAIKLNNCDSLYGLGRVYFDEHKYVKAKKYFEMAVDKKNPDAMTDLGHMYFNGLGVDVDFKKARELFEQGCKRKDMCSYNNLATVYYRGLGVTQDIRKATKLFKKSYKLGYVTSLDNLVIVYKNNNHIKPQSDVTNYFLKIDKAEKLTEIYNYDYLHIDLLKQNYALKQELEKVKRTNTDMENHIKASPDGELYFAAVKDWDEKKGKNGKN